MPVETLRPSDGRLAGGPFTSAMPFRILNKGPGYFRRAPEPAVRKLSAVERLEADKAKYVKSQQVALTRQEPVKPPVIRKPLLSPGMALENGGGGLQGPRRGPQLNLEVLNNLINIPDGPQLSSPAPSSPSASLPSSGGRSVGKAGRRPPPVPARAPRLPAAGTYASPNSVAVRRVDVRPHAEVSRGSRPGSSRRHPSLHRSKSDLSDRYSRATADLERFFNYCGLDPDEVEGMGGVEHFARASSDIISVSKLRSVSAPSSECGDNGQAPREEEDDDDEDEDGPAQPSGRVPYGISIIERNARVIKWLYGIRQARDSQNVSNV
uniref:Family with sequence similarity 110 member A n=1 Tax=Electrophorus electricus TaxID=8005 RepID=A0A4W4GKW0_ELEEL